MCSWYPTRVLAFNGNFIFKHARSLVQKGAKITVLTICEDKELTEIFEFAEGEEEGVKHLIIYYHAPFRLLKHIYKTIAYFKGIRFLKKKKGKFDLIHVHVLIDAGFIAWWDYLWNKTPYVITEHSTVYIPTDPFKYPKILKPWIRKVIQRSSYMLPVSKDLEINMQKIFSKTPFRVIPNVVNTSIFLSPEKKEKQQRIKFLHISNFIGQKNIKGLLRGFKKLSKERRDFTITLAGDGDLDEVKQIAQDIQMPLDLISFQGKMTEKEVAEIFQKHDVFVLFSNYENLPCVLVEAQVCGMPIVATDVGGVTEIVNSDVDGIVIQARDEDALVESLSDVIDNFDKYDSEKIRNRAIEKYSDDAVANAFIEVYEEVFKIK